MDPDAIIGQQIGNYVATRLLGEGGMGEVYLAEHPKIGRQVAIKVLSAHMSHHSQAADRFLAEAKAVNRIAHPNVIEIFDFGNIEDGRLYYTMEVLHGRELKAVMEEMGPMSPQEVLPYLLQISAGLQAAHELGVVHRDLKPENIFVLDAPTISIKILDFGIAKMLETTNQIGLTSTGMVMGTPMFIAPEQAAGRVDQVGPHTDLYSLGVIVYYMLAGRPPFIEEVSALLLAKHITEPPPPLHEVDPFIPMAVCQLIDQCLEKAHESRPASAAEIASRYQQALEQGTAAPHAVAVQVPAAPTGPPSPAIESPPPAQQTDKPSATLSPEGAVQRSPTPAPVAEQPAVDPASGAFPPPDAEHASATSLVAGEDIELDSLPRNNMKVILGLASGAVVLILVGVVWGISSGPGETNARAPEKQPAPRVPSPTGATAGSQEKPGAAPEARTQHTIAVKPTGPAERIDLTCYVTFESGTGVSSAPPETNVLPAPCVFKAAEGAKVKLQVKAEGYRPYTLAWTVEGERSISLGVDSRQRVIVSGEQATAAARAPRATAAAKSPPGARPTPAKASPPAAKPPLAKTRSPKQRGSQPPRLKRTPGKAKKSPKSSGPKRAVRKKVGEGTMGW